MAFLVVSLFFVVLSFAGPSILLGRGRPGGVVTVAVAHTLGCVGVSVVPGDVVSRWMFQTWLLFAPVTLWILLALWLPRSRAWVAELRRARTPAPAEVDAPA